MVKGRPLYPRERPGTHCIGGWVGSRAGLGGCGKSPPPPGFDPQTVQPVDSRYTDWAIPALLKAYTYWKEVYGFMGSMMMANICSRNMWMLWLHTCQLMHFVCNKYNLANLLQGKCIVLALSVGSVVKQDGQCTCNLILRYRVIEKMDGIWNRYNLKSTGRIYTFGVLKCSEKFKVLDLP